MVAFQKFGHNYDMFNLVMQRNQMLANNPRKKEND